MKTVMSKPVNRPNRREVLACASPLALFDGSRASESGRGLPQSKTLTRGSSPRNASKLWSLPLPTGTCGLLLAICTLALAAPRADANVAVMVRGDFVNQLYQPQGGIYTNAPADRASSLSLHGGHISAPGNAPSGTRSNLTIKLLESSFGQAVASDVPYPDFELDSILTAQGMLYAQPNWTKQQAEDSDRVFRYKVLLFAGGGSAVTSDPTRMNALWTASDRQQFAVAVKIMRDALKFAPYNRDLRHILLEAYYDRAVAEAQFVKLDLMKINEVRLGFAVNPNPAGFVIDKVIEYSTNIVSRYVTALRDYDELLAETSGVVISDYDPAAPAGIPLGTYIFQKEQPDRNQSAMQYYSTNGVLQTVPHFDPQVGTQTNRVLFSGYKDYVLLLNLLRDYGKQAAELARNYGRRGRKTAQEDDIQRAYQLVTNVQSEVHVSVTVLRSMFPDLNPPPGDASGVRAALHGVGVALAELDNVRTFLDGQTNPLGLDPNFLVLIKEFPTGPERFDSYDAFTGWIRNTPTSPLNYAQTKFNEAKAGYHNYKGYADQVKDQLDAINSTLGDRYEAITGWAISDTTSNHVRFPKSGTELWQVGENIRLASGRVENIKQQGTNIALTISNAIQAVAFALGKSNRLETAKNEYFDDTELAWNAIIVSAGAMAAAQSTYDLMTDLAEDKEGEGVAGAAVAVAANTGIAKMGCVNIVVQTIGALTTKASEKHLERAAADYEVAQTLQELPAEILQARQEFEDRRRRMT